MLFNESNKMNDSVMSAVMLTPQQYEQKTCLESLREMKNIVS